MSEKPKIKNGVTSGGASLGTTPSLKVKTNDMTIKLKVISVRGI